MGWIVTIFRAIGAFLKQVLPDIGERLKQRRDAKFIGKDDDLQADMEKSLEKDLGIGDNPADGTEPDRADSP
jgi:hypothetical protein